MYQEESKLPESNVVNSFQDRDYRLDILKAGSILLVLWVHLQPFSFSTSQESSDFSKEIVTLTNIVSFQVTSLAVPIFFIVSLYLFYVRDRGKIYFRNRVLRILKLFIFWTSIQFLVSFVIKKYFYVKKIPFTVPPMSFTQTLLEGGPRLPITGNSVFYFLLALGLLTIIAFLYMKTAKNYRIHDLTGLIIITGFIIYFEWCNLSQKFIPHWRLDNFIVYIAIAYFLVKRPTQTLGLKYYYLIGFLIFTVQDIILQLLGQEISTYGRNSIVCGAMISFVFIYSHSFKENELVKFMSRYSLGIYALHQYGNLIFTLLFEKLFTLFRISKFANLFDIQISMFSLSTGLITIVVTLLSVYVLSWTAFKKFIS